MFVARYHHPDDGTLQGLAAIMQGGCVVGSILASWAADRFGRRRSILCSMLLVALSGIVLLLPAVFTENDALAVLFVGRMLSGVGGGLACAVVPLHVSEVAPAAHRGAIETSFQLAIELGILAAYALNLGLSGTPLGWCMSLAAELPPAVAFLCWALLRLPESPRYLMMHADEAAAEQTLSALRTRHDDVSAELDAIRAEVRDPRMRQGRWSELLRREHRAPVLIAIVVLTLQVATGIDFVTVYAPRLFGQIANATGGVDEAALLHGAGGDAAVNGAARTQLLYTLLVGVVFVVVTPFAIASVDRCGRRVLLLLGGGGMTLSLTGLAFGYHAALAAPAGGGSSAWPTLCVVLLLSFVACFSFSWGPVAWVIPSELVAYQVRAKVVALGTVCNWVADYTVVGSFLSLTNAVGEAGGFATFAVINAAAFAFVFFLVPETKGRALEARQVDPTTAAGVDSVVVVPAPGP